MKKTVLTFGLISGLIISVLMGGSLLLADKIGSGHSMALGYTIMVASFLLIYFGIRSYRDNTLAGQISFGRAFACGILITLITTVCYVAMWEVLYFNFMPHFMDSYFAAQIHKVQTSGLAPPPPPRRSPLYSGLSSSTRTPSSTWLTLSWSPCPLALSSLSSPLLSSTAKLLSNPPSLPAVMTT